MVVLPDVIAPAARHRAVNTRIFAIFYHIQIAPNFHLKDRVAQPHLSVSRHLQVYFRSHQKWWHLCARFFEQFRQANICLFRRQARYSEQFRQANLSLFHRQLALNIVALRRSLNLQLSICHDLQFGPSNRFKIAELGGQIPSVGQKPLKYYVAGKIRRSPNRKTVNPNFPISKHSTPRNRCVRPIQIGHVERPISNFDYPSDIRLLKTATSFQIER